MLAMAQPFKYAELPIMKYRVFDSQSRQFTNVPIQPPTIFRWQPEEDMLCEVLDDVKHHEPDCSDKPDQQPAGGEDKKPDPEHEAEQSPEGDADPQQDQESELEQAKQPEEIEVLDDEGAPERQTSTVHCN